MIKEPSLYWSNATRKRNLPRQRWMVKKKPLPRIRNASFFTLWTLHLTDGYYLNSSTNIYDTRRSTSITDLMVHRICFSHSASENQVAKWEMFFGASWERRETTSLYWLARWRRKIYIYATCRKDLNEAWEKLWFKPIERLLCSLLPRIAPDCDWEDWGNPAFGMTGYSQMGGPASTHTVPALPGGKAPWILSTLLLSRSIWEWH